MPIFNNAKNIKLGSNQVKGLRRGLGLVFAPFNDATGGTIAEISNYNGTGEIWRVHTLTSNGTFDVSSSFEPFRILIVGGGGGGNAKSQSGTQGIVIVAYQIG